MLSADQIEAYRRDGYVVADGAVSVQSLARLRDELDGWAQEAEHRGANFGEIADGRARFDLEPAAGSRPALLRRVNSPIDISESYRAAMSDSAMTDMAADLVGPDTVFHHAKINLKLPGGATEVKVHQDFPYTPHSNTDVVTALLPLDDMTEENGCLEVVPGSHREGVFSLWQDDRFTGTVADEVLTRMAGRVVAVTAPAGSVCLMHTLLLHGSAANRSALSRRLFICVYSAADAVPLTPSPVPSPLQGEIVRGRPSRMARLEGGVVELPPPYRNASFFEVQNPSEDET